MQCPVCKQDVRFDKTEEIYEHISSTDCKDFRNPAHKKTVASDIGATVMTLRDVKYNNLLDRQR